MGPARELAEVQAVILPPALFDPGNTWCLPDPLQEWPWLSPQIILLHNESHFHNNRNSVGHTQKLRQWGKMTGWSTLDGQSMNFTKLIS